MADSPIAKDYPHYRLLDGEVVIVVDWSFGPHTVAFKRPGIISTEVADIDDLTRPTRLQLQFAGDDDSPGGLLEEGDIQEGDFVIWDNPVHEDRLGPQEVLFISDTGKTVVVCKKGRRSWAPISDYRLATPAELRDNPEIFEEKEDEDMSEEDVVEMVQIEWRDARDVDPEEGSEIVVIDNENQLKHGYYEQDARVDDSCKFFIMGANPIKWKNVEFWAPVPDNLPDRDIVKKTLNNIVSGWKTVKKDWCYKLSTSIDGQRLTGKAERENGCDVKVTLSVNSYQMVKYVYHFESVPIIGFEMALKGALDDLKVTRKNIQKIENGLDYIQ